MAQPEILWLVKSSGRVLGPFPTTKIADLLRTREISVLDEIAPAMRRWQTIQYHSEFREVVESLRKASLSERTEATWTPGGQTSNLTQTLTDFGDGELTDEVTGDIDGFSATGKEIVIDHVQEQPQAQPTRGNGRFQPEHIQNTAMEQKVERTTRGLWILTLLVLVGAAFFILRKRVFETGHGPANISSQSLKQIVVNEVQVGHYKQALKLLKDSFPDPKQSGELAIYYGSLLVQEEGQTVMGRRLLNQVLEDHRPEVKQAYTGLGLADLIDGQFDSAKDHFDQALKQDPQYVPALVNMAAVDLQKGDYAAAKSTALKALHLSPYQGEALVLVAESQLYMFKNKGGDEGLAQIDHRIKGFQSAHWDYASEIGFYGLYFDYLMHDPQMGDKLQAYLDMDPRLTTDHRHNVFIYKGRTQWKILARFCEQMVERIGDGPRTSALLASCYAREARWDSARRAIEKAVQESPKDPLIQAWYAYILRESGDADHASIQLGMATQLNRREDVMLPFILQARFCQKAGIVDCARDNWQKIYGNDLNNLPAIAGLAWVDAEIKSYGEAAKLIQKGLQISPDYIPLLELRQKGEGQGWYASR